MHAVSVIEQSPPIRVMAVDDHPLLREGIAALLSGKPELFLECEAASGQEAVALFRRFRPDVTLMDLQMPAMSGIDAIVAIRAEFPLARIIVLTTYPGDALVQRALKAGAQGYLLKSQVRKDLVDTIHAVHAGRRRVQADVAAQLARHASDDALTAKEIQVLVLIADGNSNRMIADQLVITEGTVKTHVKSILAKLDAKDRTHAATLGLERGIIGV